MKARCVCRQETTIPVWSLVSLSVSASHFSFSLSSSYCCSAASGDSGVTETGHQSRRSTRSSRFPARPSAEAAEPSSRLRRRAASLWRRITTRSTSRRALTTVTITTLLSRLRAQTTTQTSRHSRYAQPSSSLALVNRQHADTPDFSKWNTCC